MDANDEMEMLKHEYAKNIPEKARPIQECVQEMIAAINAGKPAEWQPLEKLTHRLAGSAGTYGFQPISDLCREMVDLITEGRIQAMAAQTASHTLDEWARRFTAQTTAATAKTAPKATEDAA